MNYDIYLVGVGGQGVLTIAELLIDAAFLQDIPANYYPTEGMAQRGGFVKAQVRLGREYAGPNIPEKGAHLAIAMERSEALKAVRYIKPGGDFVLWNDVWLPTAAMLGKIPYPTVETVSEQVLQAGARLHLMERNELPVYQGAPVADNVFVLGAVWARTGLRDELSAEALFRAVEERWPKHGERNHFALQAGMTRKADRAGAEVKP